MIKSLLRRSSDVGCRYGGEEFCLILPETDDKGALALAQEICENVRQQQVYNNENVIKLTVSCGVTTYQQEKEITPEIIFEYVDKALYKAKAAGRENLVCRIALYFARFINSVGMNKIYIVIGNKYEQRLWSISCPSNAPYAL
jgi:diguanylate cyclase (GGDEF)-like protein